ncbi:hypothetical protein MLD38_021379 [Melastoma candidum]|uniref:Uncharacterized protein n=1 Tax=Melastoma candidum TaxID=119954 RepID=A0ACB9QJB0_9MYRT|nr:hypothetical protein MLD38_021379 [Melastoma candidum]
MEINIPFVEALEQMPKYPKFMREMLSNKHRLGDHKTIALIEECSAILQKKILPKLKDLGNFTIHCNIGNEFSRQPLCDLATRIHLMSYSIFQKLNIGEVRPTFVTLQLTNQSHTYPKGVIEDVLVKVDKFIFPIDFVVLE